MEKEQNKIRTIINVMAYSLLLFMMSCKASFEQIDYGKDACVHCKMTIIDKRFAAEMLTAKGRAYKFDDVHCLKQYLAENKISDNKAMFFVASYNNGSTSFLDATKAFYLQSDAFKSPMNGNYAAFATEMATQQVADSYRATAINWESIK